MNNYDNLSSIEDLKELFLEFENGYISDVISEIADNSIDIYNYNLLNSAWDLYSSGAYDEAMSEFGSSGEMIKDFQTAQYHFYSNLLYENIEDVLITWTSNYCSFTPEEMEFIKDNFNDWYAIERLEDIEETLEEWLQEEMEDTEE